MVEFSQIFFSLKWKVMLVRSFGIFIQRGFAFDLAVKVDLWTPCPKKSKVDFFDQ